MSWNKGKDDHRRVTESEKNRYGLQSIKDCLEGEEARNDKQWYLATSRDGDLIKMQNPYSTYRYTKADGTIWVKVAKKEFLESLADRTKAKKTGSDQKSIGYDDTKAIGWGED
jgi:hypothetical protein